jgi:peptidyl-tRNA hydrolase
VLPLVVRLERATPPTRTDALEAAALAVLRVLSDDRASTDWAEALAQWEGHRIRKVVRRARGAQWAQVETLDGLTVERGTAQVRVFPSIPLDRWPRDLARLQVSGTELGDPEPPGPAVDGVPVLWLSPHQPMTAGKAMAQVGHAAQLGWWASDPASRAAWLAAGLPLAVRLGDASIWRAALAAGLPLVRDGGFTEVEPGAQTAIADVPWLR